MPDSTVTPKLNPSVGRAIVKAELDCIRADRALKAKKRKRDETRAKYAEVVPFGTEVEGFGHRIKRWMSGGGKVFKLSAYLEAHDVTPEMEEFIEDRDRFERWSVEPIDGPPAP